MIVDDFKPTNKVKFQTSAVVSSYLTPLDHKIITIEVGQKIQDILDINDLSDVVIYKDDLLVSTEYIAKENDVFYIYVIPEGGSAGNIIKTVALIAIMAIAAPIVSGYLIGAGFTTAAGGLSVMGSVLYGVGMAAIGIVASMALNKLIPPDIPTTGDSLGTDSATYGWGDTTNKKVEGVILPILLGSHRVKPPHINAYISTAQDGTQTLNQLFAVNLGEVDSISDVVINNNNIENYTNTTYHIRTGTPTQTVMGASTSLEPDFTRTRTDFSQFNRTLNTGWYYFDTNQEVDKFGLTVTFQGLGQFNDNGDFIDYTVDCMIEYSSNGGQTWVTSTLTCTAKTQEVKPFYFESPNIPKAIYKIRIKRISEDSTSTKILDKCLLTRHTEYLAGVSQRHPSVALLAIKALATDQLSGGLPTVSALVSRLGKDIAKPLNNPAWACRFLITKYLNGTVNETKFSEWAFYCISNGYTVNLYIETQMSFKKVLDMIASLGQGYIFQKGLQWDCRWESFTSAPVQAFIFNDSNIAYDSYNEQYLNIEERFNTLELTYFDAEFDYERNTLIMQQDNVDIEKKTNLVLYGCTSRAMAIKLGKIALRKMRYETLISSWSCDIDALHCGLYDIVYVQHSAPKWNNGVGSLIQSATSNTITLDQNVTLDAGVSYRVRVQHINTDIVEERFTVPVSANTTTTTLTLTTNFTVIPIKNSKYTFADGRYFKIINISKLDDLRTKIVAIEYVQEIYNVDVIVYPIDYTPALTTSNIVFTETLQYDNQRNIIEVLNISLVSNKLSNEVFISLDGVTYTKYGQTFFTNTTNIYNLKRNTLYYFKVNGVKVSYNFLGKFVPPNPVDEVSGTESGNIFTLDWVHSEAKTDIDFSEYVIYLQDAEIGRTKNKTFSYYSYGLDIKTFTIKSIDTSLVLSTGVSINLQASAPAPVTALVITESLETWELSWSYGYTPQDFSKFLIYKDYDLVGETTGYVFSTSITRNTSNFRVIAVDVVGNLSTYIGQNASVGALSDISTINASYLNNALLMFWSPIRSTKTPIVYEVRKGATWDNAQPIDITQEYQSTLSSNGTYMVKPTYTFSSGVKIESVNPAILVIDEAKLMENVLVTWNETIIGWAGAKSNVIVDDVGCIKLTNPNSSGTYTIPDSHIITLAQSKICTISYNLEHYGINVNSASFDSFTNVDLVTSIDGTVASDFNVEVQISTSIDGVTFSPYSRLIAGDYLAKVFKFRLFLESFSLDVIPYIENFDFTIDMPDLYESGSNTSANTVKSIVYTNNFSVAPTVLITIVNAQSGDDAILTNQTDESFDIIIKNGGTNVVRTFNYFVKGY